MIIEVGFLFCVLLYLNINRGGKNLKKVRKAIIPAAGLGTRFLPDNEGDAKRNVADC